MHTPITAIVIFRNERRALGRCLRALTWCDEIIAVNMASKDGSVEVAEKYADRLFHVDPHPIAEPTRVVAAGLARHDWVLLVDPDEIIPASMAGEIRRTLRRQPKLGAVSLPMRFYFKRELLEGTVWGTLTHKRRLIHRARCRLSPFCNRISEAPTEHEEAKLDEASAGHIRHEWSNSYLDLLWKHFRRYSHLEAKAMAAEGERFGLRTALLNPVRELYKSLRDFDGWRIGPRGWLLSGIYFGYCLASGWLTLVYQWSMPRETSGAVRLPILIEDQRVLAQRESQPQTLRLAA